MNAFCDQTSFGGPGTEPNAHYGPFSAVTFHESGLIFLELILHTREQRSQ